MLIPTIENEVFTKVPVEMDDKRFLGCKFSGCTLRYEGGKCLGTTRQSSTPLADGKSAERQLELSIFLPEPVRLRPVPPILFFDYTDMKI